jgi:hypothetical protein
MESHDHEPEASKNDEPRAVPEWQDCRQSSNTAKPCHIVDLAHVKYSSQATLQRKGLHHDFMHDLRKQTNRLANKYRVFTATYVVDNQPRRVEIRVWIVTSVIHGTNA